MGASEGARLSALRLWGLRPVGGAFEDQALADWRDDVVAMLDDVVKGPAVLVGSSMGGWLMLLAARARPEQVKALVGIAPAPDFTDWGFSTEDKMALPVSGGWSGPILMAPRPPSIPAVSGRRARPTG